MNNNLTLIIYLKRHDTLGVSSYIIELKCEQKETDRLNRQKLIADH